MNNNSVRRETLLIDTGVYRLTAIKKALYKFSGRCLLNIELTGERGVRVAIECADPLVDMQELIREIHCEVTDQELREVVLEET
ncbi:MAG: hypothetical protein JWM11_2164, partial [Planctomycetaceae bacterium]|nr:hypothetical protein [Planctomycetaceae bacterium]